MTEIVFVFILLLTIERPGWMNLKSEMKFLIGSEM